MGRFSHIAGDPTLDLINTVEWRLGADQREEDLASYALVLEWCRESDLLTDAEQRRLARLAERDPDAAERQRRAVIDLREAAYGALLDHDEDAAARLAAAHRAALQQARLERVGDGWRWADAEVGLATPAHRIARALIDLLARDDLDRLHQCEDAKCGWVFLDTSPRRNRRWCVTKDCGDRNRARAYYARKKAEA